MRLAGATLLATAVLASPATAGTVSRVTPVSGPVLAGDRVVWAQSGGQVFDAAPGEAPRELIRVPPATEPGTTRAIVRAPWALAASPTHVAALVRTTTPVDDPEFGPSALSRFGVIGGAIGSTSLLDGDVPPRGDGSCEESIHDPESVAVDGARIAIAQRDGECGRGVLAHDITILDGAERVKIRVRTSAPITRMRLAGRYIAFILDGKRDKLVVADADRAGTEVTRLEIATIPDFDIDASGRFALTYGLRRHPREYRLGWTSVSRVTTRTLARGVAPRGVALANGKVLYQRGSRLLLRRIANGSTRRLATFTTRRPRAGALDLDATRAAWGTRGRIVTRGL